MEHLLKLKPEQIKEIIEKGFTVMYINDKLIKVTKDDLVFKKEEIEKFEQSEEYKNL